MRAHKILHAIRTWSTSDQGDVPGWVLITLMTAGIVVALWAVASPALGQLFNTAITRVVSF
ncbi:MAG: hypothetical protein ACOYKK_03250 [Microbacteriaceae bacterium]|jgi:hypothetical protein